MVIPCIGEALRWTMASVVRSVDECKPEMGRVRRRRPDRLWTNMGAPSGDQLAPAGPWQLYGPLPGRCQYIFLGKRVEEELSKSEGGAPMARRDGPVGATSRTEKACRLLRMRDGGGSHP